MQFEIEFPRIRSDTYCEIACVTHARAESPALRFALDRVSKIVSGLDTDTAAARST